jgi:hypothetical protein
MPPEAYDVIVIGGGTAGVVAAIQAGRAGASTLLVEKNGMLGGTITSAGVDLPGLFHAWTRQVIAGIGWELVERCARECGIPLPDFTRQQADTHWREQVRINRALFPALCDEAVREAGVHLWLHTMPARITGHGRTRTVTLCTKTGLVTARGRTLIDATGDANAVTLAGCRVTRPPEVQPGTLICHASGYDPKAVNLEALRPAFEEEVRLGRLKRTDMGWDPTRFDAKWVRNAGENANHVSGINASTSEGKTQMEMAARASLLRVFRFLRRQPGFENLRLDYVAAECGVRETVTIVGKKTITGEDYVSGRLWEDAVCYSFYPVDLHTAEGSGVDCRPLKEGVVPTIPRGAMLPAGRANFIVAGRCVSSDRVANSALRTQASCMAMGQAAGAMAALAASTGTEVEALPLESIRDLLRRHGAIVPG